MPGRQPGDRLTLTAAAGVVIARRAAAPPAAAGDWVLLAVFPAQNALAAYSFAVVDQAPRAHAPVPGEGRGA